MKKGIDCATKISAETAEKLKSEGYSFVCRYHVPEDSWKSLTRSEAKIISNEGLKILSVYETYADRAAMGAEAGREDGAAAYEVANELGTPENAVIYFAVDFDAGEDLMDAVEAYLRAAREETKAFEIGVYGSFKVVEEMAARNVCKGFWQTYAWSRGEKSQFANVYQYLNDQSAAGINVDFDEATSLDGMWSLIPDNSTEAAAEFNLEDEMRRYQYLSEVPEENDFRAIIKTLMDIGVLKGEGASDGGESVLNLSEDQVRMLVILYRGGAFDRKLTEKGLPPAVN